jgi:histidine decarboxylase
MLKVDDLVAQLAERSATHAGYPYNLTYDYSALLPLFQYTLNNLGDPYLEGRYGISAWNYERAVIDWFAKLYNLPSEQAWGYVTNAGTEGNLYGILLGRELFPSGILYSSEDTHYSVAKAAHMFRMEHVVIASQPNGEMDYAALAAQLAKRPNIPAILNLNIGTTVKGAVDRIESVLDTLEQSQVVDFHLHCDGALGGMLVPYLDGAPAIDFSQYPIGSVSVSGHKFIGSPLPCGILLTRKAFVNELTALSEYIGSSDTTMMGSRCGLAAVILWQAIEQRQHQFAQEAQQCVANAAYFCQRLQNSGLNPWLNPFSTTVVFDRPVESLCNHWQIATYQKIAHIVVMQNHDRQFLDTIADQLIESDRQTT